MWPVQWHSPEEDTTVKLSRETQKDLWTPDLRQSALLSSSFEVVVEFPERLIFIPIYFPAANFRFLHHK